MKKTILFLLLPVVCGLSAQNKADRIVIQSNEGKNIIPKEIYGQFAEHLGSCIYGGIWVGENSPIPNIKGYRVDVLNALKELQVPVLRWPGGCFADEYHWMDEIGPREKRPKMVNNNWGGVVEDNSFGTHEFLDLCEMLGIEPYISGNVGSGTVEELAKWIEYMTSDGDSPMANLRRKNGRDKAWKVKYIGVGNESWGCGGNMTPDYYSDLYRRYSTYCRDYDGNRLFKIASGASDWDVNWTETLMKKVGNRMQGLSLHYYTSLGWDASNTFATKFTKGEYLLTMAKCLDMKEIIRRQTAIMDQYDPEKKIALMVDEWGTWWKQEPGSHTALFQQNTMRDALVAASTLNIFNQNTGRVKMANIAQIVNVLQAMILTDGPKMVLTPTYYVFDMYKVHMGATNLPLQVQTDSLMAGNKKIPALSVSASKTDKGVVHITIANIDPDNVRKLDIDPGMGSLKSASGIIISAKSIDSFNSFDQPNVVATKPFANIKTNKAGIALEIPAGSIVAVELY